MKNTNGYIPYMVTKFESLISWLAFPIYVWQGLGVRRKTVRLDPPQRQPFVTAKPKKKSKKPPMSVMVLGDSSAVGVGVTDFKNSVAGQLPYQLAEKMGREVTVHTVGNNSATAGDLLNYVVPNLAAANYDFIALQIGTNDAKNFHSGNRFCKEFGRLLYALHAKFPDAQIIWSGVIDLAQVEMLPKPLNYILGIRSRIIDRNGKILCVERNAHGPKSKWQPIKENFSIDGFHASEKGYRLWAEELSDYIVEYETRPLAE